MGRSMLLLLWCASIASLLAPGLKLLALAQQNRGFISIDSGANSSPDDNFKLYYEGDNGYTDSGENKQVSTGDMYTAYHQIARTLRSFPNGTRNCYTLKPDRGKNNLYLIRTYFWYGNYDRKNETPTFDLYIDVNYWTTISSPNIVVVEIMYVPRADYIQVCVVDMGSGIPFISALELRVLNNSIYQIGSDFLKLIWRANMGTSNQSFTRSPVDVYDRIWWGNDDYYELSPSTGASATSLSNNNDPYKVPGEVLLTATTMKDGYSSLRFSWTPPKPYVPPGNWILYFHFAETQILRSGQQREFTVSINGNQFTKSVTLEYLKPVTVVSTPVTGSPINILISPTSNESPYLPILNAIEVYNIVGLPNVQTAEDDVKAINDTKATYGVNKESWQGDPCVPSNYTWDGLNCSYEKLPRIISLDLSSSNLRGNIHSSLSNLSELESLDLSNNQLWGAIPETLAKLPKLRNLNLSGNNLTGSVPKALKRRVADKTLNLSLDGNPDLCKADPCPQKKNEKSISVPVAASVSAFFVVLVCALATICLIKRKNVREPSGQMSRLRIFKYDEILTITENFQTEIGKGASGKVYQGKLKEDTEVAVKVLSESSSQGKKQFQAEKELLMTVYHGNLVSLIGYCDDSKNMVLIYEFMANGNLQQHLSGTKPNVLTWDRRLRIAVDVAQGLDYLHNTCGMPIIHRDIKTTNILLNENMQAKISDFGLSRALKAANSTYESSNPWGTLGYVPPEYQPSAHKIKQKSDVYSFGIVLLELMTGQQAMMSGGEGEDVPIRGWAISIIKSGDMHRLMDRRLQGKFDIGSAKIAAGVAESCTREEADTRPDISHVLADLKGAIELASKQKYEDGNQGEHTEVTSLEVDSDSAPLNPKSEDQMFKYGDFKRITKDFETIIGEGASGKVYLGELEDTKVAVKELSKSSGAESSSQPDKPFLAEVSEKDSIICSFDSSIPCFENVDMKITFMILQAQLLTTVHHGNLVSLKGYCDDSKNKALIYEFMANRNLKRHLSGQDVGVTGAKPNVLTWDRRLRIAVDVAQGLDYLHNGCNPSIIHRDIKTTNILLNENMQAKISDFSLSRPLAAANSSYMSTSPLGTPAYLVPKYKPFAYELNKKSDVYSFGIVLLELISGHPAINTSGDGKSVHIREWAIPKFKNGNICGLIDPKVEEKFDIDSAEIAAKVAESCTQEKPEAMLDINRVLIDLKRAIELASKHKYVDGNQEEHIEATSLEVELDNAPLVRVVHSIH